ncbi:hypothetical protein [Burkholderia thailandensis]|uniref:hypothetical protein n=1 Tax=Burkholderia thailandensis TaxID=57975 RepID=UPI0003EC83BC|nr:hypothetical protein [Burkholderia thailandensis]AHI63925.1 hypothetical protein BTL_1317 [Burkholderia thailandensis H0587]
MKSVITAVMEVPADAWAAVRFLGKAFASEAISFWRDMGKHSSEIYPSDDPDEDETARWW